MISDSSKKYLTFISLFLKINPTNDGKNQTNDGKRTGKFPGEKTEGSRDHEGKNPGRSPSRLENK